RAAAVGKQAHVLDLAGKVVKSLPHPSTVGGLAFDTKGKRLAASHYGGASLWFVGAKEDKPKVLEWKGSHHLIAFSPDGTHVVTTMQETALHGWRLADGQHMRMSGYPTKTRSIAFDAKGKRIAASHYNGASLWFVNAKEDKPRVLDWKGSHAAIAIHPDGTHVVTAMQEMALHGWRLADGQHMRMSGYPSKTHSLSFTSKGKWLATSGAESVVLWPFFGGGPMGKAPTELAGGDGVICTRVACHPQHEMVAAGFEDGLVLLTDINTGRVLPVAPPGQGGISALAWNASGSLLAFGTETGFVAIVDLTPR
ncbi:MAG: repeat protein, partial [Rubritepida sp.]|nr:repeat protein [Rubritepida sp.]